MPYRKKLIEVALPLVEINDASAYDKMPGIGPHPKSIHKWWAPLPLPSARAVLFASLVDDPSSDPRFANASEEEQTAERERLFTIMRGLMVKKVHEHPEVFEAAHAEILRSCEGDLPAMLDPFAGSGAIPIEGQRLGLQVYASDLNPIPVMINKVLIEILPRFARQVPVNPDANTGTAQNIEWRSARGLAADLRYYGKWMLERARKKLESLYPKAPNGEQVIAWLWARTVKCPNPVCGTTMPLISTFELSTKKGKKVWFEPVIDRTAKTVQYRVVSGNGRAPEPPKTGQGAKFRCLVCERPAPEKYIKEEGMAKRMGAQLTGIIADGGGGRLYYAPTPEHEAAAHLAEPEWQPIGELADDPRNIWVRLYGLLDVANLFTTRQLTALTTFSDLLPLAREQILEDARELADKEAYVNALMTLLALVLDRCADFNNSLCRWKPSGEQIIQLFSRQAIPMVWDYVEANILGEQAISWYTATGIVADAVEAALIGDPQPGSARQVDAATLNHPAKSLIVSTDPPYYDNISYAGLSDVFYVWLRSSLKSIYPDIFGTLLVPKSAELIADPDRFGGEAGAKKHFEDGFRRVFTSLNEQLDPRFPMTVYYAFKQSDTQDEGDSDVIDLTTGWETLLDALISSGFQITATWPVRASQSWRLRSMGANALASYIVLACRPRPDSASTISRRGFIDSLRRELPAAIHVMQSGNLAPVDLAQASIGPGMSVYSRYKAVLDADGTPLSVRAALSIINQELDTYLSEQDADIDSDTRFAVAWFEQYGFKEGEYGIAEVLARAKNTGMNGVESAGLVQSGRGKVRLIHWTEYDPGAYDPAKDQRATVWESAHHLIERLTNHGENGAARLLVKLKSDNASAARDLAYRLFNVSERKGWSDHARDYNALVISWSAISEQAAEIKEDAAKGEATNQLGLFEE